MQNNEMDFSCWATFTQDELDFLANLKDFLDEQEHKRQDEIAFHRSVWDAALDATNDPIFGCKVVKEDSK